MTNLRLEMTFKNSEGRSNKISVDNAKPDLTQEEVNTAMDGILSNNIFTSSGGELTDKIKAELVATEIIEFDML